MSVTARYGPPNFDPVAVYPEIGALRAVVAAADWPGTVRVIAGIGDVNVRYTVMAQVGQLPNTEHFLAAVPTTDPAVILARTLLADRHIQLGWLARTGMRAKHVTRNQFAIMHQHLRTAERALIDITAREPHNAYAAALRLTTARGLELGQSEAARRYARLARYHPHLFFAQSRHLQQLCPKWSGSWPAAHAFAHECSQAAPPGHPSHSLVAEYHLERWLDLGRGEPGGTYLRQPDVLAEVSTAAARYLAAPGPARAGAMSAHGSFAMLFSLAGDLDRAAPHFAAIGNTPNEHPWQYFNNKAEAFAQRRDAALGRR